MRRGVGRRTTFVALVMAAALATASVAGASSGTRARAATRGVDGNTVKVAMISADLSVLTERHLAPDIGNAVDTAKAVVAEINDTGAAGKYKLELSPHVIQGTDIINLDVAPRTLPGGNPGRQGIRGRDRRRRRDRHDPVRHRAEQDPGSLHGRVARQPLPRGEGPALRGRFEQRLRGRPRLRRVSRRSSETPRHSRRATRSGSSGSTIPTSRRRSTTRSSQR